MTSGFRWWFRYCKKSAAKSNGNFPTPAASGHARPSGLNSAEQPWPLASGWSKPESNGAKPRGLGRFFPARHRAQIKKKPLGLTMLARAVHLLARSGYFYSAWFSLGNDSRSKNSPSGPGAPPLRGAAVRGARFPLVPGAARPASPPSPPPTWGRAVTSAAGLRVWGGGGGRRSFAWP
jgi:hypothetical protein